MTKFIFKSNASDLQKIIAINETIQKNVLYLTYRMDMLIKRYDRAETDKGLQKQVDDYFDDDAEEKAEQVPEQLAPIVPIIKRGLYLAGRIDKKYNLNKIFIDKYLPPGYRKGAYKIVDVAGALGGGYGIYNFIQSLYAPDTPGNDDAQTIQQRNGFKTDKSYKARPRFATRYSTKRPVCYQSRRRSRRTSYR